MSSCDHRQFEAWVELFDLTDAGRYQLELRVRCAICGAPFRFLGLPIGVDLQGASMNEDGTHARLAVLPAERPH
jgi:hypothetical protein